MADTNELTQSRTVRNGGVGCVYELQEKIHLNIRHLIAVHAPYSSFCDMLFLHPTSFFPLIPLPQHQVLTFTLYMYVEGNFRCVLLIGLTQSS